MLQKNKKQRAPEDCGGLRPPAPSWPAAQIDEFGASVTFLFFYDLFHKQKNRSRAPCPQWQLFQCSMVSRTFQDSMSQCSFWEDMFLEVQGEAWIIQSNIISICINLSWVFISVINLKPNGSEIEKQRSEFADLGCQSKFSQIATNTTENIEN